MSNGDEVLDSWEEIDEVGLSNTLQKLEAERKNQQQQGSNNTIPKSSNSTTYSTACTNNDLQFGTPITTSAASTPSPTMKLLQRSANASKTNATSGTALAATGKVKSPLDDMASTFQPVMMVLHKPPDEYQSANYVPAVNMQTVKILRRPTQSSEQRNNDLRPKQPIKTLQQREQEYAEARLRILGSAKNPEDDASGSKTSTATAAAAAAITTTASVAASAAATTTTSTWTRPANTNNINNNNNNNNNSNINTSVGKMNTPPPPRNQTTQIQQNAYNTQFVQHQHHQQQMQQKQQQQQQHYFFTQMQQPPPLLPAYKNRSPLSTMALHQQATFQLQPLNNVQQQQQQTWSPAVGGSVSSTHLLRQQQQQQQQQQSPTPMHFHTHNQQESVLRLPRGPDGSTGFQMRR